MRILHIASEAVPWAKTGGLADVVGALCAYLVGSGHEVALALPLYGELGAAGPEPDAPSVALRTGPAPDVEVLRDTSAADFEVWWVDAPRLFDREGLYGTADGDFPDNALRFATLVRGALTASVALDWRPDVIHAHDWQGALAPVFVRGEHANEWTVPPVTMLTIHNMAYQGAFSAEAALAAGLPESSALVQGDGVGFLKGGILSADRVTTVSPRYASEIGTPRFGFGLDPWIADLEPPVLGVLNGIDTDVWNPAIDPLLPETYDVTDMSGKAVCKAALQAEVGLAVAPDVPLFGMVSRLIQQKGLSLIADLGDRLVQRLAQFVFLGTGEPRYEQLIEDLAARHPNVAARLTFSERLAHRIEAGADFFLMPSEFEPCGLNQMISQRYGTPPIVHRVGGLADSVRHASRGALKAGDATGVVFDRFSARRLSRAVNRARDIYGKPATLAAMRRAGMETDFSWRRSGLEYERLYRHLLENRNGAA